LLPNPLGPSQSDDGDFNVVGGEIFATFSPWASWLSGGNPFAPLALPMLSAAVTGAGSTTAIDPGSAVAVTSGGITINLLYDAAALAAPASFRAGIQQAVSILAAAISDKITLNIKIDYSGSGGGAAAGPDHGLFQSYSSIRADLINNATPGDTTFNALAAGSSIQGQSNVAVWNAQLKLWGLMAANDTTTDDGSATFATDINPNLLVGVALHELTHAIGRIPYGPQPDIFDFFRFTTAGTRLFQGGATAPAAYFSLDGGNTKIADYGRTSDASDFLNSGVQGANDPFNEFYNGGTSQQLTATDLKQLDALGFHLNSGTPGSVVISDASVTEGNSGTTVETFMVTRTGGTAAFDVSFSTADGTARVADHDYLASAGTLHFGTGVNTQPITITVNGDVQPEFNETFLVNLSGATNGAAISDGQGVGTIVNDDLIFATPTFELADFAPGAGGWNSDDHYPRELADVNGDGMADIVGFGEAGVYVSLATGGGSFGTPSMRLGAFAHADGWSSASAYPRQLADVNGDHMADIVGFGENGVWVALATGDGSFGTPSLKLGAFAHADGWTSNDAYPRELADVNKDGMADIVGFGENGVWVALATGGGSFGTPSMRLGAFAHADGWSSESAYPRHLADVNGDHVADIVGFGENGVWVGLATGGGAFGTPSLQLDNFSHGAGGWTSENMYPRQLADVNHDGAADIIGFGESGVWEALSNGFHLV
ncbi:MAG: hypothetical protein QOF07_104, partial [Bradyrhizobium sp.]|nr:hypothetical protein [Bradyrhizobium sp.]